MFTRQRLHKTLQLGLSVIVALAMVGLFVLVGGLGTRPGNNVVRAQDGGSGLVSITSISIPSCVSGPSIDGTVNLDGNFTGTITLELFYQAGSVTRGFVDSGQSTTATFTDSSSATYSFSPFTPIAGAKSYRVDVLSAPSGINQPSTNTKSQSVPPCAGTTTTTTTVTKTTTTSTSVTKTTT